MIEEEFRPNPFYKPLTAEEHRALAKELDRIYHRLSGLADDLVAIQDHDGFCCAACKANRRATTAAC